MRSCHSEDPEHKRYKCMKPCLRRCTTFTEDSSPQHAFDKLQGINSAASPEYSSDENFQIISSKILEEAGQDPGNSHAESACPEKRRKISHDVLEPEVGDDQSGTVANEDTDRTHECGIGDVLSASSPNATDRITEGFSDDTEKDSKPSSHLNQKDVEGPQPGIQQSIELETEDCSNDAPRESVDQLGRNKHSGHPCSKLCYEDCGKCTVEVQKVSATTGPTDVV